jgi:predicted O-methyltransferase YrrM
MVMDTSIWYFNDLHDKANLGLRMSLVTMVPEPIKYILRPFYYFPKRLRFATSWYNKRYFWILKWLFQSQETSNFTYDLTDKNIKYLIHTISIVLNKSYSEISGYLDEIKENEELLAHIFSVAKDEKKGMINQLKKETNSFGRRMGWYIFARATKPKLIVETGVERGHGSILLAYALKKNKEDGYIGEYIGTDINPGAGILFTGEYQEYGKIMYGDSIESLKKIERPIDLFINDSDHCHEYEAMEYETIKDKLSTSGIILGDNSHVSDKLSLFSIREKRAFLFFKEDPKQHWYPGAGIGISWRK